eukprot:175263-Alexandrium_andersonii.AAC.1
MFFLSDDERRELRGILGTAVARLNEIRERRRPPLFPGPAIVIPSLEERDFLPPPPPPGPPPVVDLVHEG